MIDDQGGNGIEAMMDLQLNYRSSTKQTEDNQQTAVASMPLTLDGLVIEERMIG